MANIRALFSREQYNTEEDKMFYPTVTLISSNLYIKPPVSPKFTPFGPNKLTKHRKTKQQVVVVVTVAVKVIVVRKLYINIEKISVVEMLLVCIVHCTITTVCLDTLCVVCRVKHYV